MKKQLKSGGLMFIVAFILCGAAMVWSSGDKVYAFSGEGSGIPGRPYLIETAAQLDEVGDDLTAHYRLVADIDLSGPDFADWEPIGEGGSHSFFTGTFDGNGHTISNLNISDSGNDLGLFGTIRNATIQNLGLINVNVTGSTSESENVGGLAGYAENSTIENVYVTGSVTGNSEVGGLVGYFLQTSPVEFGNIRYSYAAVTVTGATGVGGLVGTWDGFVTANYCYWNYDMTPGSALGIGRSTDEMKSAAGFDGWSFTGEGQWRIVEDITFPMHRDTFGRIALNHLSVNNGAVSVEVEPDFDGSRLAYSGRVRGDVDSVTVTATPLNGSSAVTINGGGEAEIAVNPGANTVNIDVSTAGINLPGTSDNPFTLGYTLTVVREDGSATYPHRIRTAGELAAIGTGVFDPGGHYELLNDLDLADEGYTNWEPIGTVGAPFTGQFDGRHHVIYNLNIARPSEDGVGLFGYSSGVIQYVGLERAEVSGREGTGALVGVNDGLVSNVYAVGNVTGNSNVGGLIGSGSGDVTNAYYVGEVEGSGLAGGIVGAGGGNVTNAYWNADVIGFAASGGGEGKTTAEMRTQSTYAGWDFTNDWAMMDGTSYPMWKRHFETVKLTNATVTPLTGAAVWDTAFSPERGVYTVTLNPYAPEVAIAATTADPSASVVIDGTVGAALTKPVSPGDNPVAIEITDASGYVKGIYRVTVLVPVPALTGVTVPADGDYRYGDTLTFIVSYEGDVQVTGIPRLPLQIGSDMAYADYVGKPAGESNKLIFEYPIPMGLTDLDGLELGAAIDVPAGAGVAASGQNVPIALPAVDLSGVRLDSLAPEVILTQTPDSGIPTTGTVTVAAAVGDDGSGVAVVKWAEGARSKSFFAAGGTVLSGGNFQASANGTYTVYARDAFGNETVETIEIRNIISELPAITWNYSPVAVTNSPVTISVTAEVYGAEGGNSLTALRWLTGSRDFADFAGGTNGADIAVARQFTVTANGAYTVYARDAVGNETVREISIANIVTQAPELTLDYSPTTPSDGPVTITVTANVYGEVAGNGLTALRWLSGSRSPADFAGGTNGVDIAVARQFAVTANGAYTVYARDAAGNETMREIAISNIVATPSSDDDSSSDDGGGSSTAGPDNCGSGCFILRAGEAKEWTVDGMTISIPEGATDEVLTLTLRKVASPSLADDVPQNYLSSVYEALKSNDKPFLKPVTLHIAFSSDQVRPNQRVAIFYYDEEAAQWMEIGGRVQGDTVAAQVDHFTKFAVLAVAVTNEQSDETASFTDLEGHWARERVMEAARLGIVHGYPDRTFRPDESVTRAEFAAMLMNVFGWEASSDQELTFEDRSTIPPWASAAMKTAVQHGAVGGYPDRTVRPNDPVSRAEMAAIVVRALRLPPPEESATSFADDDAIPAWAKPFVAAAEQADLVEGDDRRRFNPAAELTRAEAAAVLLQLHSLRP